MINRDLISLRHGHNGGGEELMIIFHGVLVACGCLAEIVIEVPPARAHLSGMMFALKMADGFCVERNHTAVVRRWLERCVLRWRAAARTARRTALIAEELMAATWAPGRLPQTGEWPAGLSSSSG